MFSYIQDGLNNSAMVLSFLITILNVIAGVLKGTIITFLADYMINQLHNLWNLKSVPSFLLLIFQWQLYVCRRCYQFIKKVQLRGRKLFKLYFQNKYRTNCLSQIFAICHSQYFKFYHSWFQNKWIYIQISCFMKNKRKW